MAEICRGVVSDGESSATCKSPSSLAARHRRVELRRIRFAAGDPTPDDSETENNKRPKLELPKNCDKFSDRINFSSSDHLTVSKEARQMEGQDGAAVMLVGPRERVEVGPRYGMASVCGRRRDMEDAVAVHPSFTVPEFHYFGVYDGHGCSHVATRCKERLHELVKEELENNEAASTTWKSTMERSFFRMDKEVSFWNQSGFEGASCRCELRRSDSEAVGSTAITAVVTSDKIVVANCGDSRAVLCRGGKAVPLSTDHKPDRPDELNRIQAAGGRVIYWDGPRVLGVLAMSRAIGDNYLKPYVSSEPEVTETSRAADDDCLILASDGLWDVVSNETACRVARMCLKGNATSTSSQLRAMEEREEASSSGGGRNADKACSDAAMLLTKLALARRSTDNVSVVVIDLRRDV